MIWPRKFIHLDMDAFFAAVEQRDNPALRGKPVIVGGDPGSRSVVSTCSYEARKFGVHSAMPAAQAKRLCPEGIFIHPHFEKYSAVSRTVMSILRTYTPLVEQVSFDEAYLDVTENLLRVEDPAKLASLIKQHVRAVTKLTASAGVATAMFLAKIASDFRKPDGLTVVLPGQETAFLKDLPVRKLPGVGPKTEEALLRRGIRLCGEIRNVPEGKLTEWFGKWGAHLARMAEGKDDREVVPHWEPTQLSMEETFERDILKIEWLKDKLAELSMQVFSELSRKGKSGRTIVLKVKYHDFEQITRSRTLPEPPEDWQRIRATVEELLLAKTLAGKKAIRLLGVGVSGLNVHREAPPSKPVQKELF
ncbi:MAG TPA: DNA polymerase IV [Candidatus Omnitrophota bacterium]|jgi:DNA polymerase-4|nr:MAG: DNA polymerase IV [Candidatus Omnitrophica bacterium ADurb.Bin314]HQB94555.1 DNA polymerase IV [Candidatus Omnitrophota bacterium]